MFSSSTVNILDRMIKNILVCLQHLKTLFILCQYELNDINLLLNFDLHFLRIINFLGMCLYTRPIVTQLFLIIKWGMNSPVRCHVCHYHWTSGFHARTVPLKRTRGTHKHPVSLGWNKTCNTSLSAVVSSMSPVEGVP